MTSCKVGGGGFSFLYKGACKGVVQRKKYSILVEICVTSNIEPFLPNCLSTARARIPNIQIPNPFENRMF